MLGLGVPDMRPAVMPERFEEALEATGGDERVAALRGGVRRLVRRAGGGARRRVASTTTTCTRSNILAGDRFYDWGDAVVAHPFASMLGRARATPTATLSALRDAYLEAFSDLAPHAELVRTLELACRVGKVARALTWVRAVGEDHAAPRRALAAVLEPSYVGGF